MKKLAIITTHPIQYNAPLFRLLTERNKLVVKVFYTWGQLEKGPKYDPGFAKNVKWDIPLLDGYDFTFVTNVSSRPGSHHFYGIDNPTLIKEVRDWDADALLVFGWSFKSHLKLLRYFSGKKMILFRGDSNLLDEAKNFSLKSVTRKIFLKWVYRHINVALYTGTANKDYYLKYGVKDDRLTFAPHAIDNDRFSNDDDIGRRLSLKIPEEGIVFLFAGKFEIKKNPGILLEAFITLDDPNSYLLLAGNGELEEELRHRCRQAPVSTQNRIHFLDFQNQTAMPGLYKASDVLVLPSQGPGETWGLSVNEAMAASRAVLVSDKCGCYLDLVQDGVNGYVFTSKDAKELVDKMKIMIADKNKTREMGQASGKIIADWSFTNICLAIENTMNYI